MSLSRQQRDGFLLGTTGLAVALGYGLLPIDFGSAPISSSDAWARGVAQPYVIAGCLLVILAFLHARSYAWARWPIILWCPVTLIGGMQWAISQGIARFDLAEFAVLGAPVLLIWIWATYRMPPGTLNKSGEPANKRFNRDGRKAVRPLS